TGAGATTITTSQTTTSGTYANLATAGPDVAVTIPASGNALVVVTANIQGPSGSSNFAYMSYSTTGACARDASDTDALQRSQGTSSSTGFIQASAVSVATGLSAGAHTFRACYRTDGGGTGTFANRTLVVVPLP